MKVHITIEGQRSGQEVAIDLSAEEDRLVFAVPNIGRTASCTFSVPAEALQEAMGHLAPKTETGDEIALRLAREPKAAQFKRVRERTGKQIVRTPG